MRSTAIFGEDEPASEWGLQVISWCFHRVARGHSAGGRWLARAARGHKGGSSVDTSAEPQPPQSLLRQRSKQLNGASGIARALRCDLIGSISLRGFVERSPTA